MSRGRMATANLGSDDCLASPVPFCYLHGNPGVFSVVMSQDPLVAPTDPAVNSNPRIEKGGSDHIHLAQVHHILVKQKVEPGIDVVKPDHDLPWTGLIGLLMRFRELVVFGVKNEALGDGPHELVFDDLVNFNDIPTSTPGRGSPIASMLVKTLPMFLEGLTLAIRADEEARLKKKMMISVEIEREGKSAEL
ncbi:hypothetical protein CDL15_Pgr011929 [Punica granatum]|uniref:Uncharacterized protein n=1 Tax=Punica granatum TaxID=22663 RepID=A0A218WD66_PUNGR|nr:hypothetical protein CDL15_Pgr011929 [Punica granatum]